MLPVSLVTEGHTINYHLQPGLPAHLTVEVDCLKASLSNSLHMTTTQQYPLCNGEQASVTMSAIAANSVLTWQSREIDIRVSCRQSFLCKEEEIVMCVQTTSCARL